MERVNESAGLVGWETDTLLPAELSEATPPAGCDVLAITAASQSNTQCGQALCCSLHCGTLEPASEDEQNAVQAVHGKRV